MGQQAGLRRGFIVFRPNSIISSSEMTFFRKFLFRCSLFFWAPEFRFAQICVAFRLEMGQRVRLHKRFIIFQLNSIVSAYEMAFFWKFSFECSFFSPKFRFMQIYAAFQLEIGQQVGLHRRYIIFNQIPSFRPLKWHFFKHFNFAAHFIYVAFRLEMGLWAGHRERFIIFSQIPSFQPPK